MTVCMLMLPSCLTTAVWRSSAGTGDPPRTVPSLIGESTESSGGGLVFGGEGRVREAWLQGEDGEAVWSMASPRGGDAASIVLAGRAGPVEKVEIHAVRSYVDADLTRSSAEVRVFTAFERDRIGRSVTWGEIGTEAAEVLAAERRNAFAFAADPWLLFPRVHRECLRRLDTLDLGRVLDGRLASHVDVLAFVLVDDEGLPCFEPGSTRRPAPPLADEAVTLDERLELLAPFDAIVRARIDGEERLLRLDLEQVWLWAGADAVGGRLVHKGTWALYPADPEKPAGGGGERVAFEATIRTRRYELVRASPWIREDNDVGSKLLMSLLTIPLDILTLPIQAIFNDDEDEDEPFRVRRRR